MSGLFMSPGKQAQQAGSQDMQYAEQMIAQAEQYQQQQEGQLRNAIAGLGPNPFFAAGSSMSPKSYAVNPKDVQNFRERMPKQNAPRQYGKSPGHTRGNHHNGASAMNQQQNPGAAHSAQPVAPGSPHAPAAPPQMHGGPVMAGGGGLFQGGSMHQANPQQGHGQWGPGSQWYANHRAPQMLQGNPFRPPGQGTVAPPGLFQGGQMNGAPAYFNGAGNPGAGMNGAPAYFNGAGNPGAGMNGAPVIGNPFRQPMPPMQGGPVMAPRPMGGAQPRFGPRAF